MMDDKEIDAMIKELFSITEVEWVLMRRKSQETCREIVRRHLPSGPTKISSSQVAST